VTTFSRFPAQCLRRDLVSNRDLQTRITVSVAMRAPLEIPEQNLSRDNKQAGKRFDRLHAITCLDVFPSPSPPPSLLLLKLTTWQFSEHAIERLTSWRSWRSWRLASFKHANLHTSHAKQLSPSTAEDARGGGSINGIIDFRLSHRVPPCADESSERAGCYSNCIA
jgi:hypothetical protein